MIDTIGGEDILITGAFFGNAKNFQGYGVGQARYGGRYLGQDCHVDDDYLGGNGTTIVEFSKRSFFFSHHFFFYFFFLIFSLHAFAHSDGLDTHIVKLDALICKTAPGIGSLHAWQVRFGRQMWKSNAVQATVMSYMPPMITAMDSSQWPFEFTEGGSLVSIQGKFFGPPSSERGVGGIGNVVYGNSKQFELASHSFPKGRWQYFAPFRSDLLNYLTFCV